MDSPEAVNGGPAPPAGRLARVIVGECDGIGYAVVATPDGVALTFNGQSGMLKLTKGLAEVIGRDLVNMAELCD